MAERSRLGRIAETRLTRGLLVEHTAVEISCPGMGEADSSLRSE